MSEIAQLIASQAERIIREQAERAEFDIVLILGKRVSWPEWMIKRLGYEVVYQYCLGGAAFADYRGIRRRGKWVIDHFPHWPTIKETR